MQIQTQIVFIRCFRRIFRWIQIQSSIAYPENTQNECGSHNPGTLRSESKMILTGTETFYLNAGAFTNLNIDFFFNV